MKGGGGGDREEEGKGCGSKRVARLEERTTGWMRGGRRVLRGGRARVEERRELSRRYFFSLPELYLPFEERVLAGSRLCRSLRWCFCFLAHL